jgi:hypothetical protein
MSEVDQETVNDLVVDETNDVVGHVSEESKQPEQEALPPFATAEEKMLAMEEIRLLQKNIDTVYYMPKYDQGNKGRQARKITGSVALNFYPAEMLSKWGNRVMELTSRL